MAQRQRLFLMVILFRPEKSIQGPFLATKKNPVSTGEEDSRIIPAARESFMYVSIDSLSGWDKLYRRLVGRGAPGSKSIAQSYGRCGGRDMARCLLKASLRS